MSLRRELMKAHAGETYRWFNCTGNNCDYRGLFRDTPTIEIVCPLDTCRGQMRRGRKIALDKYVLLLMVRMTSPQHPLNPDLNARFRSISPTTRREIERLRVAMTSNFLDAEKLANDADSTISEELADGDAY